MSTSLARRKAQLSIELIVFIGIAFLTLLIFAGLTTERLVSVRLRGEQYTLHQAVQQLESEITLAATVSDGYSRNFTLPKKLNNQDYDIEMLNNSVILASTDRFESVKITFNVTGQPLKGNNIITKNNGFITLN